MGSNGHWAWDAPAPLSHAQLEMIYLSRWGWNQSAAGRGFRLNELRLFLWSLNEFIRWRRWAARKAEHGGEMRVVMVSLVHAPPAFQNNFQSSDQKKRSVTAASVKHNLVSSGPSFTWLKGVTPELVIFVQDSKFVSDHDLNNQLWLQKQLLNMLDCPQVATLP